METLSVDASTADIIRTISMAVAAFVAVCAAWIAKRQLSLLKKARRFEIDVLALFGYPDVEQMRLRAGEIQ